MSFQITDAFVQQYNANVMHLSQQQGSRLRGMVRQETVHGKSDYFDRIGAVSAVKKTSRHGNTPQLDTPNSRRMVALNDYEWADLIDKQDQIRLLIDPASEYAKAAGWAMGRAMDDEIIAAALGNAMTGETGATPVALPTAQKVAAVSGAAHSNLNLDTLRMVKYILDSNDIDPELPRYFAYNASALANLLSITQVTSVDYNSIKALVTGQLDTYMGFKFVRIERVLQTANAFSFDTATGLYSGSGSAVTLGAGVKSCFAWAGDGLLLGVGAEPVARISERDDKSYATQVYNAMSVGAVRMEEAKVVEVICKQA